MKASPRVPRGTGRRAYDLILLDHHMPGRDGLEVARDLAGRGSRVILLSSAGRHGGGPGISASLTKPVRDSRLYDTIATTMADGPRPRPRVAPRLAATADA